MSRFVMQDKKSLKMNTCRRNLASFPRGLGTRLGEP